jgi:peptide deformylase
MAYRQILKFPDPCLRAKSMPIIEFDESLAALVSDLDDTLNVCGGVGLSAPQIGVFQRVIYIRSDDFTGVMVNPEILESAQENLLQEGCLSFPGIFEKVKRFTIVDCRYFDATGKEQKVVLKNLSAHIVQHEIEHLEGILLIDKLGTIKRERIRRRARKELRLAKRSNGHLDTPHRKKANSHLTKKEIKIRKKNRSSSKR